jgi:hypothetical protein
MRAVRQKMEKSRILRMKIKRKLKYREQSAEDRDEKSEIGGMRA